MQTLRRNYAIHKTYKRIQRLWQEYKSVSDKNDLDLMRQKLTVFLDSFQIAYKEWGFEEPGFSLDRIYGDCTEVLISVLNIIDKETSEGLQNITDSEKKEQIQSLIVLVNKALNVAELILKDEKYRTIVAKTPNLINTILTLLERLDATETKKLALRLISTLGETNENKMEIGRHQGFKKILKLLLEGDEGLTQEILKTLRHIMEVKHQEGGITRVNSQSNFFGMGEKFSAVLNDVGRVIVGEVYKYFNSKESGHRENNLNSSENNSSYSSQFVLPKEEVDRIIQSVINPQPETSKEIEQEEDLSLNYSAESEPNEILKDLMRVQGALTTLTQALRESEKGEGKFGIMETLSKLLFKNHKNQEAFKKIDGYAVFQQLMDSTIFDNFSQKISFLEDVFNIFFTLCLDGDENKIIGNFDILKLVVKISVSSSYLHVRLQGLLCLQDLICSNPSNAVILKELGCVDAFMQVISQVVKVRLEEVPNTLGLINLNEEIKEEKEREMERKKQRETERQKEMERKKKEKEEREKEKEKEREREKEKEKDQEKLETKEEDLKSKETEDKIDENLEDQEESHDFEKKRDPVQSYLLGILEILNIISIILSSHNSYILQEYTRILLEIDIPCDNPFAADLMNSVSKLLTDINFRGQKVDTKFLDLYVLMLGRMQSSICKNEPDPDQDYLHLFKRMEDMSRPRADSTLSKSSEDHHHSKQRQDLLLLEILSHLVDFKTGDFSKFEELKGFELLISLGMCQSSKYLPDLPEMVIWMLREFVISSEKNISLIKWPVFFLECVNKQENIKAERSPTFLYMNGDHSQSKQQKEIVIKDTLKLWLKRIICHLLLDLLNHSIFPIQIRTTLKEIGGLDILISTIQESTNEQISLIAATALRDSFYGVEMNKIYLTEKLGYKKLLECFSSSGCAENENLFLVFLEMNLIENLPIGLSDVDIDQTFLTSSLASNIYRILAPGPLYLELPLVSSQRKVRFKSNEEENLDRSEDPSIQNSLLKTKNNNPSFSSTNGLSKNMTRSASKSSLISRSSQLSLKQYSLSHHSRQGSSQDTQSIESYDEDSPSITFRAKSSNRSSRPSSESSSSMVTSNPTLAQYLVQSCKWLNLEDLGDVVGTVFRDSSAALYSLQYQIYLSEKLKIMCLQFILLIMEANPRNKKLISKNDCLRNFILLGIQQHSEELQTCYLETIVSLAAYDISESNTKMIFEIIFDPANQKLLDMCQNVNFVADAPLKKEKPLLLCPPETIELNLLTCLRRISQEQDPPCYFNMNGIDGYISMSIDKLPSSKTGYTVSCWVRVISFLEKETGLFSIEDSNGRPVFELFFKSYANASKNYMSIRTHNHPAAPEDFVFDTGGHIRPGCWHFIVFTHKKQTATMYLDGSILQTTSTFNFPKIEKGKNWMGIVGRKKRPGELGENLKRKSSSLSPSGSLSRGGGSTLLSSMPKTSTSETTDSKIPLQESETFTPCGFLCGCLGSIHFYEGCWDIQLCQKFFAMGFTSTKASRSMANESRPFFVIDPQEYYSKLEHDDNSSTSSGTAESHPTSIELSRSESFFWFSGTIEYASLEGGCDIHQVRQLHETIRETGSLMHVLAFQKTPTLRLEALKIINSCLTANPLCRKEFNEQKGYSILLYQLQSSAFELTAELFQVLIDMVSEGVMRRGTKIITNIDCFRLVLDLLPSISNEVVQKQTLRSLVSMAEENENIQIWRENLGVDSLFELLHILPDKLRPLALRILDKMIDTFSTDDLERLFNFLSHDRRQSLEIKFDVFELLLKNITHNLQLIEAIKSSGGMMLMISLLDVPSDKIRTIILKIIGMLLTSSPQQSKALMQKQVGFEAMWLNLAPFPVVPDLCEAILKIGLGSYKCEAKKSDENIVSTKSDESTNGENQEELLFPEAVHLLLNLLKTAEDLETTFGALTDLKRLLSARNMEILWETNWLDWISAFIRDRLSFNDKNAMGRVNSVLEGIMQRLVVYDLSRKNSVVAKTKGALTEDDSLMTQIVEVVLDHFCNNPTLNSSRSSDILKNLLYLVRYAERELGATYRVFELYINCVDKLVVNNTAEIRNMLKNLGLLEVRDEIVIHVLQSESISNEDRVSFVKNFSFEMVADQTKFRDSNGILFLLRIFHTSNYDKSFQAFLIDILVSVFAPIEENRKVISKIIDDFQVLGKLYSIGIQEQEKTSEDGGSITKSGSSISLDQKERNSESDTFVGWYYSTEPEIVLKRTSIEQKIEKIILTLDSVEMKNQEKLVNRKNKRLKGFRDKQLKNSGTLNKSLTEVKSKSTQKISKNAGLHQHQLESTRNARKERVKQGEDYWRKISLSILDKYPSFKFVS